MVPLDWLYFHYWTDQTSYIQFITAATNVIFKIGAYSPFSFGGFNKLLAAANTTPITGGSEPVAADIKKVVLGNYSGTTMNYVLSIIL